jgi:hypothetical protein
VKEVGVVGTGVTPSVVVRVSVDGTFPPVLATDAGLNDAVTPGGSALLTLKGEVHKDPLH